MLDCHIHLETGPYTLAWVKKYVGYALQRGLSEIHLLEHSYLCLLYTSDAADEL